MQTLDTLDRYKGALYGLACGDAVGTTHEFLERGRIPPVTDMVGGGAFNLMPGQWTDDTSMALCLAESLICKKGHHPRDQMTRYLNWYEWGYLSSNGHCFDIGGTTRRAITDFKNNSEQAYQGKKDHSCSGNGSLMRLVPAVLYYYPNVSDVLKYAVDSSRTTHASDEVLDCVKLFSLLMCNELNGVSYPRLSEQEKSFLDIKSPLVKDIMNATYLKKSKEFIKGTGRAAQSLEAALWSFQSSTSFEEAILLATNLGDDADTTAAICGQIAGIHYGMSGIPEKWIKKLTLSEYIGELAEKLYTKEEMPHLME